jgi:hypothetical protein
VLRTRATTSFQRLVTGIFWEAFSAGNAVTALLCTGFGEGDVDSVGVSAGRAPDVSNCLITMGIDPIDATYCNNCFEDGADAVARSNRGAPRQTHCS